MSEMDGRGVRLVGNRLRPPSDSTTVRVRGAEVMISDGPFAETKEQVFGFDLLECADLDEAIEAAVAAAFRDEWGRVVATLIRMTGDWDLAEGCAQDAVAQALARRPRDGVPRNPGARLTTAARNAALNRLKRSKIEAAKLRELATLPGPADPGDESAIPDERLRLISPAATPPCPSKAGWR